MQKARAILNNLVNKICTSSYFNYVIGALLVLALLLRAIKITNTNSDLDGFIILWFNKISQQGFVNAFSHPVWDYAFLYPYLLYIKSLFFSEFNVIVIKLFSIAFDILMAFYAYRILRLFINKKPAILFAMLFLCIPTQWFNSSVWGQIDSILCALFMLSFYYLVTAKYARAIFFFALTTTLKTTFIFFLPFLGLYWLVNRFSLRYFLIILATYLAMALPSLLAGLPLDEIFYSLNKQAALPKNISYASMFNFHSLFGRVKNSSSLYVPLVYGGLTLTFTLLLFLSLIIWQKRHFILQKNNQEKTLFWLLTLLITFYLVPFFLPRMHDRYYYFATMIAFLYMVLSINYHTKRPFITWLPFIVLEISSFMTYLKTLKLTYLEFFGPWGNLMFTPVRFFVVPLVLIGLIILCQELNYLLKNNAKNEKLGSF